jgi:hypothetical protein
MLLHARQQPGVQTKGPGGRWSQGFNEANLANLASGTLGTANVKLRARARVDSTATNTDRVDFQERLEDLATPVPNVPILGRLGRQK